MVGFRIDEPAYIPSPKRILSVDALRGLAVVLMVQQHLGIWLVNVYRYAAEVRGGFGYINMTGGLAAPLFVTLLGVGIALAGPEHMSVRRGLARGASLLAVAYLLNLAVTSWFSWGSFYVLHLLAVALIFSPWFVRWKSYSLIGGAALILVASVAGQTFLQTPIKLDQATMSDATARWGVLRLALIEGQFPIFPWLSLVLVGVWAGRTIRSGDVRALWWGAICCGVLASALRTVVLFSSDAVTTLPLRAICRTSFFPLSSVYALFLSGLSLALLALFHRIAAGPNAKRLEFLTPLGRSSLTLLWVHIVVFRQGLFCLGWQYASSPWLAIVVIVGFLVAWQRLARRWQRATFRYGLEWLLRRAG